ncbi:LUD domain-containing protein [Candidatus Woesearchaeota archaeon]|nr:LUD domain-containing protein [Candidatus Woesearchaeota archaeon]
MPYDTVASSDIIRMTAEALKANGFDVVVAKDDTDAKKKTLALIPNDAEVMNMTSATLDTLGISQEAANLPNAVRKRVDDKSLSEQDRKKLGSCPAIAIGSVHAVTQDGHVLIASASGSQLPAYVYGAGKVIWVVGAQKIVKDTQDGMKRVYEYTLPLEDARARKVYGMGSGVHNLLIMNANPFFKGRITIIIVPEKLGF